MLYIHHGPETIEIVRITPTSQAAGAAFELAVEKARQAYWEVHG